jgi:hypothetical protein
MWDKYLRLPKLVSNNRVRISHLNAVERHKNLVEVRWQKNDRHHDQDTQERVPHDFLLNWLVPRVFWHKKPREAVRHSQWDDHQQRHRDEHRPGFPEAHTCRAFWMKKLKVETQELDPEEKPQRDIWPFNSQLCKN